jgi:cysteine desulfurase / selenocysteine lyase
MMDRSLQGDKDWNVPHDVPHDEVLGARARLVVATHANNVTEAILPIPEIAALAHAAGALLLVDAAQTPGVVPLDLPASGIDLLAFTGHKGLCGPPGTGGLVFGEHVEAGACAPLVCGGTGSRSESEEQPEDLPDKFEGGTPNGVGIAGLGAGVRVILERGVERIRAHEVEVTTRLLDGLQEIPGVRVYGPTAPQHRTAVVSFTVAGRPVSDVGLRLDEEHGVLCRVGLHCAPATHRTIGPFPTGTVRMAPGIFTTRPEVETAVAAVRKVVSR